VDKRETIIEEIFDDYEARANFVGFFQLLYKIDRRLEPQRYQVEAEYHD
jgi:hypothetical protein